MLYQLIIPPIQEIHTPSHACYQHHQLSYLPSFFRYNFSHSYFSSPPLSSPFPLPSLLLPLSPPSSHPPKCQYFHHFYLLSGMHVIHMIIVVMSLPRHSTPGPIIACWSFQHSNVAVLTVKWGLNIIVASHAISILTRMHYNDHCHLSFLAIVKKLRECPFC